jgi:hypothetical protein
VLASETAEKSEPAGARLGTRVARPGEKTRHGAGHGELLAAAPRQPILTAPPGHEPARLEPAKGGEDASVAGAPSERRRVRISENQREHATFGHTAI